MSLLGNAAVTIWHDVRPDAREDYFAWHNREHMAERVGIPGFLRGRRYGALDGQPEFCTLYEAESLDVLTGPDYLACLENPSPWTRRAAPQLYGNVRSLCKVALSLGSGMGALARTWRYDVPLERGKAHRERLESQLHLLAACPGIVGAHLCLGDSEASAVQSAEKKTRPNKALTPNWVIIVEGGAERRMLEDVCGEFLPAALFAEAGAVDLASGLYQLQFVPD